MRGTVISIFVIGCFFFALDKDYYGLFEYNFISLALFIF